MHLLNPLTTYYLPLIILLACLLDLALGDPRWLPHPVRWMGRYITFLENKIRQFARTPKAEKVGGIALFLIVVTTVFGLSWFLLQLTTHNSPLIAFILSVFLAYTTLSIKSLHHEAYGVVEALKNAPPPLSSPLEGEGGVGEHLDEARKRLSQIVGRDTHNFSEEEIYRAVTETIAENTSDGIIAPLFYLAIGGPALALAYKAINTLDSMVGYKHEKYKNFGWFSARMDDIANYIPARITAVLMVIASFLLGLDWKNALKIVWRESRYHPSPNAGYPEAAVAGALGLQLGGINYYFGRPHKRPFIGAPVNNFSITSIRNSIRIMYSVTFTFVLILIVTLFIFDLL